MEKFKIPEASTQTTFIAKEPFCTKWYLELFGSKGSLRYHPPKDYEPSWLVRKMCSFFFDCVWVKNPNFKEDKYG